MPRDSEVEREATERRLDWKGGSHFANWRRYVGPRVRAVWHTLSDDQKVAVALDAHERAKDAEYD